MNNNQVTKPVAQEQAPSRKFAIELFTKMFQNDGTQITEQKLYEMVYTLNIMGSTKNLTELNEYYSFIKFCIKMNVDPTLKEVYCYKGRDGKIVPIISFMIYIREASKHPNYQLPIVEEYDTDKDGNPLPMEEGYTIARIKRKGDDTVLTKKFVYKEGVVPTNPMGKKQPRHMLYVRTLKNALAIAYPEHVAAFEAMEFERDIDNDVNVVKATSTTVKRIAPKAPVQPVKELNKVEVASVLAPITDGEE